VLAWSLLSLLTAYTLPKIDLMLARKRRQLRFLPSILLDIMALLPVGLLYVIVDLLLFRETKEPVQEPPTEQAPAIEDGDEDE